MAARKAIVLLVLLATMACEAPRIIDVRAPGSSAPSDLYRDTLECERIAEDNISVVEESAKQGLIGSAIAAGGGVALAYLTGDASLLFAGATGAAGGLIGGGVKGASSAYEQREEVITKCLSKRGHSILN